MAATIRAVDYFYITVNDRPGEACALLRQLASAQINLLAFTAMPSGINQTQMVVFPENADRLARAAEDADLSLTGSSRAFVDVHQKLCDAQINVVNATGIADSRGGYGYIIYVRPEDFDQAAHELGL